MSPWYEHGLVIICLFLPELYHDANRSNNVVCFDIATILDLFDSFCVPLTRCRNVYYIDDFVQVYGIPSADALGILRGFTEPSI